MAIYPNAIKKLIRPGSHDPRMDACGIVFHVAVSKSDSLHTFFLHDGGIESHFYVRYDGTVEQYRDTAWEADAQSKGNSFFRHGRRVGFISVETEGMGPGTWTKAQVESLQALTLWAAAEHGFPLRKCPGPYSPGVGYHRLFSAWNPNHHSCPGPDRVRQFDRVFVPWLHGAAKGLGHLGSSVGGAVVAPGTPPRMNPANYYIGAHGPWVYWLDERLIAHGFGKHGDGNGFQPGHTFTKYDRANVRAFQLAQGWTGSGADGFPGPLTLKRLAAKPKARHKAPATPDKPAVPTRIQNFLSKYQDQNVIDMGILDRAVKGGRRGTVRQVRDSLAALVKRLPRK